MASETESANPSERRLLVIDDERIAPKNLSHVLRKAGYRVSTAASGPEGLEQR